MGEVMSAAPLFYNTLKEKIDIGDIAGDNTGNKSTPTQQEQYHCYQAEIVVAE
ncbi:hypothetical protein BDD12DRAFT_889224 [Trichophaea hybrida]|nr:hypothetical protein BDD12DRAFT_889224 [Trichophaea hybrida]